MSSDVRKAPMKEDGWTSSSESDDVEEEESPSVARTGCFGNQGCKNCSHRDWDEERPPARFVSQGQLNGTVSHDGSPHVTDEVFNAASHLAAGILSILGTATLIAGASAHGKPWAIVAFSLYGASLCLLFWSSFLHHALHGSPALMRTFRQLDHVAIYFLIPGTMTPVCLVCLHDQWVGWVIFGSSWGLAVIGAIMQIACTGPLELPTWASMTFYITLGWFGAFLAPPALECIGWGGCALMTLGGLAYTGGGAIFTMQRPNPIPGKFGFHEIWHVFVVLGAGFHYAMIFFFVWPAMIADS